MNPIYIIQAARVSEGWRVVQPRSYNETERG